jgi:hypothetical protein
METATRLWEMSEKIESLSDEVDRLRAENERLRKALATYACRCGDGDCYKDEFVASCGRSAREALGLILNANSLPYAQEIASKALGEDG